jgi:DNA-binding GntR family transcriptional regulator
MPSTTAKSRLPLTRAGAVAAQLRELINSGEIPPGSRLRQTEVARRFGVSTTPVREAFVALAREGLVRQDTHRGVVVFVPSVEELEEIYEIRGVLEPLATRLAAGKLREAELAALDRIVAEMRTARAAFAGGPDRSAATIPSCSSWTCLRYCSSYCATFMLM